MHKPDLVLMLTDNQNLELEVVIHSLRIVVIVAKVVEIKKRINIQFCSSSLFHWYIYIHINFLINNL